MNAYIWISGFSCIWKNLWFALCSSVDFDSAGGTAKDWSWEMMLREKFSHGIPHYSTVSNDNSVRENDCGKPRCAIMKWNFSWSWFCFPLNHLCSCTISYRPVRPKRGREKGGVGRRERAPERASALGTRHAVFGVRSDTKHTWQPKCIALGALSFLVNETFGPDHL